MREIKSFPEVQTPATHTNNHTLFNMQMCHVRSLLTALVTLSVAPAHVDGCDFTKCACGAYAPGDVVMGITLPCHRSVKAAQERIKPDSFHCSGWVEDLINFLDLMILFHTVFLYTLVLNPFLRKKVYLVM